MNNKDTLEKIAADIKSQRPHVNVEGVQYISYYYMNEIKDRLEAIMAKPDESKEPMSLSDLTDHDIEIFSDNLRASGFDLSAYEHEDTVEKILDAVFDSFPLVLVK